MSSINLEALSQRYPDKTPLIARMAAYLGGVRDEQSLKNRSSFLSLPRIFDAVTPDSKAELVSILSSLVELGVLQKVVRLESKRLGGIQDFPSVADIPSVIYDPETEQDIRVSLDDIHILFKLIAS